MEQANADCELIAAASNIKGIMGFMSFTID
jgi:hypothetical protein